MKKDQLQGVTDVLSSPAESLAPPDSTSSRGNYLWQFHKDALSAIAHSWLPPEIPRDPVLLRRRAEAHVLAFLGETGSWPDFQPRTGLTPDSSLYATTVLMSSVSHKVIVNSLVKREALAFQVWTAALDVKRILSDARQSFRLGEEFPILDCTLRLLTLSACGLDRRLFYAAWWNGENLIAQASSASESPRPESAEVVDDNPYLNEDNPVTTEVGQVVDREVRS